LLGNVEPQVPVSHTVHGRERIALGTVERIALTVEPGIHVPLLLLLPEKGPGRRPPVVVALAQHGKQAFLRDRPDTLAELLRGGAVVCLPDLRGTGESQPTRDFRGRSSPSTFLSATELMLGQTLLGARLRDLRTLLGYLRSRTDLDSGRLALWGDTFAPVNPPDRDLRVPLDADPLPDQAEPLGGLLALFGALFEQDVQAVCAQGGLVGYQALLESPFCYLPHDVVVPGALTAGDLSDVAAALAPRSLRLEGLRDSHNRLVAAEVLQATYASAAAAYRAHRLPDPLQPSPGSVASWLLARLKQPQ